MMSLLDQFLSEARDALRSISSLLLRLEEDSSDVAATQELFRLVHTLKGNSGLFDFPEMTRVLHASEDLLDSFRHGQTTYSRALADQLLEAMDFVGGLVEELEQTGTLQTAPAAAASALSSALRGLLGSAGGGPSGAALPQAPAHPQPDVADLPGSPAPDGPTHTRPPALPPSAAQIPPPHLQALDGTTETARMEAYRRAMAGAPLHWIHYFPDEQCFFNGDDPLLQALGTPDLIACSLQPRAPWPPLAELDAYRCMLDFYILSSAHDDQLQQHFRYMPENVTVHTLDPLDLVRLQGDTSGGPMESGFVADGLAFLDANDLGRLKQAIQTYLALCSPTLWISSALSWLNCMIEAGPTDPALLRSMLESLRTLTPPHWPSAPVLTAPEPAQGAAETLTGREEDRSAPASRNASRMEMDSPEALTRRESDRTNPADRGQRNEQPARAAGLTPGGGPGGTDHVKYGRRAEDQPGSRTLKVDQIRIDRLMNLIGEMVVAKNALPYLAMRAENQYGVRELSREIKAQFGVINRIAEEMQDAIMQVRMMPVSFVFQRFPRLVRDLSHRLKKEVHLVLQGEDTEADKNIIEALADPLIHIVRNSLDHGLELPAERVAAGKPSVGTLTIRAAQESDRVVIEILDDGKGIDPVIIKQKALEKGVIDAIRAESLTDREAIQLIFEPGFSTADAISDLSGRGVGMDVVRTTVAKVNGTLHLESAVGKGTLLRIALPLSMAVTKVMIVEADGQSFGIPMDAVVETVRVSSDSIHAIKQQRVVVLRNRIVPLNALSHLLGLSANPKLNVDNECAVLVIRKGNETAGLIVDEFRETVDVIQKPMQGILSGLGAYSGSALMGDGSVLMVLNVKELV